MPELSQYDLRCIYDEFVACVSDEEKVLSIDSQDYYMVTDEELDSSLEDDFDMAYENVYDYLDERGFDEDDVGEASRTIKVIAAIAFTPSVDVFIESSDEDDGDPGGHNSV